MAIEVETRILNGLPVLVVGRVYPPEPDVGYNGGAEIDDICWLDGRSLPTRMWEKLSADDYAACEEAIMEAGQ